NRVRHQGKRRRVALDQHVDRRGTGEPQLLLARAPQLGEKIVVVDDDVGMSRCDQLLACVRNGGSFDEAAGTLAALGRRLEEIVAAAHRDLRSCIICTNLSNSTAISCGPGEASGCPWKLYAGWSVSSMPCSEPSKSERCVGFTL